MKIEEAIQQKKFKNEFHKMSVNILYTAGWMNSQHQSRLKKFGISGQQFNILRILRGQYPKPASVNLLIERMLDKMSNASRLVEKLRLKGLVERKVCESDRRGVDVVITKKGLALLEKLDGHMEVWEEDLKSLTLTEAKELNRLLDKLRTEKK
ncbi:MAG TPA: MarR family transcriptional regulator [Bacteroidetes bacterium]|nr:MarR family transcriptional regulator [Bacteroidota bacterium]